MHLPPQKIMVSMFNLRFFWGDLPPGHVDPPPYLGMRLNWSWDVSVSCWKLPRSPLESWCNKGGWGWWEPPCGVFLYSYIPGEIWMGCDWKTCQFILYILFFLGWVPKVSFCFFFQVCQSSRVVELKKQQQINEQRLVHLKKQSEKTEKHGSNTSASL